MVLGVTPLGFIPIPPVNATILHVPVVIGAILEGPVVGAMIGLIFGIFSIIRAITTPNMLSYAFINPLVSVFPRILIGIFSYYAYKSIKIKKESLRIGAAAIIGSFTNTIGVLGMIYLLYLEKYAASIKLSTAAARKGIISIALINGLPEAIICAVITVVVVLAIGKTRIKR
jgi:Predicted membrane protein